MKIKFYYWNTFGYFTWSKYSHSINVYGGEAYEKIYTRLKELGSFDYFGHSYEDGTFGFLVSDSTLEALKKDENYEMVQYVRANNKLGIMHYDFNLWLQEQRTIYNKK